MARKRVYLAPLISVVAFWYISRSWEHHSLPERPRLSTVLLLLISACLFYVSSFMLQYAPAVDERFSSPATRSRSELLGDKESAKLDSTARTPQRPSQWTLPVLVALIAVRIELFHFVQNHRQCSANGVEFYLCFLLIIYQLFSRTSNNRKDMEENEDPWRSVLDDFYDWLRSGRVRLLVALLAAFFFARGSVSVFSQAPKSTYMCFALTESGSTVAFMQFLALPGDAAILILLWQILAWASSLKLRLRALSGVFGFSACATLFMGVLSLGSRGKSGALPWLYGFDIIIDSIALAILAISMTVWVCETSPIMAVTAVTIVSGIGHASFNIYGLGTWMVLENTEQLLLLWMLSTMSVIIIYALDMRTIVMLRRGGFVLFLVALLITGLIITLKRPAPMFTDRHPLNDLVYRARAEHDRWQTRASTSKSLETAVRVYKKLHDGTEPPSKFEEWYNFAKDSAVIDYFEQIDNDLEPFRQLSPGTLRQRVEEMLRQPGVASLTIHKGRVVLKDVGDEVKDEALINLGALVQKFSTHIPDMVLPINLGPAPRVLPKWEARRGGKVATDFGILHGAKTGRTATTLNGAKTKRNADSESQAELPTWQSTTAAEFRGMLREGCPLNSAARANPFWNSGILCWNCIKQYSNGQFIKDWHKSLDTCSQPDLKYFHGFWMTNPRILPVRELLPLFGAAKTEQFADILIPLPQPLDKAPDLPAEQAARNPLLHWMGTVGEHLITDEALHGSHKFRLAHMANKASLEETATVLRWKTGQGQNKAQKDEKEKEKKTWAFEQMPAQKASSELPINIGIGSYSACLAGTCDLAKQAFGEHDNTPGSDMALANKYVFLLDGDDGPDRATLRTLRSRSLPFMATIFRTWYSERLRPWLHFVPIDVRYHGLHSTIAHFTGLANQEQESGGSQDADWIASEGRKWSERALGEHDMEVYLFRLLLEWSRLIDDGRSEATTNSNGS